MATRKKYTDALSRVEQSAKKLDSFYIEVGKVMLTEFPKLGDFRPRSYAKLLDSSRMFWRVAGR